MAPADHVRWPTEQLPGRESDLPEIAGIVDNLRFIVKYLTAVYREGVSMTVKRFDHVGAS
jgi:hypothetical protein